MTTLSLAEAQVEIIEAQAKLIKQQSMEIMQLEHKLEQREYNRRFTNTKFVKAELASPTFTKAEGPMPPFNYTREETKLKRKRK